MIRRFLCILSLLLTGCSSLRVLPEEEYVILPTFQPSKPIELALVLGGGGSKGLAHLGAIQELEKAGIRPDLIIGCSAGAIAGALYADQPELQNAINRLIPLRKRDVLDYSYMNPVFGIVNGDLLQNLMGDLLNARHFDDLKIPLIVVATDLISGETVEICCGDIPSAIRASCSFPGVFKPYQLYGRHCIDGGASCPIPVSVAKKYGAKVVLAIDLSEKLPTEHPTNLFGVTRRGLEIAYRKFVEQSLALADISIQMNFDELGTFTDDQNYWLYRQGQEIIRTHLADIKTKLHMAKLGLPSKRKAIERQISYGMDHIDIELSVP
ncbi:MAG TPA: patatin-like phospholipase family protein [Chlamydiales bacterium]|nr:patatin-like phospholipase family protein [Chlamydiales bacterium]